MKKETGITLVSLVVTIIILIILAGISINTLVGDNGIITKAQQAKENTLLAQEEEAKQLNQLYMQMQSEEIADANNENIQEIREQLNNMQNQLNILQKQLEENTFFIDTKTVIATLCNGSNLTQIEYTATENCIIAGYVRTWLTDGGAKVYIDDVAILALGGSDTTYGDCNALYIPLKKGQKIKIQFNNNNNGTNVVKAYKLLS